MISKFVQDIISNLQKLQDYCLTITLISSSMLTKSIILYSHMPGYHISGLNVILKEILTETLLNN